MLNALENKILFLVPNSLGAILAKWCVVVISAYVHLWLFVSLPLIYLAFSIMFYRV